MEFHMTDVIAAAAPKQIAMGNTVKDAVTGFTGIVIQRLEYLNGNIQWAIQPVMAEGDKALPDVIFLDYHMLDYVDEGVASRATPCVDNSGIKLGELVEDKASGFQGIATQRCEYLNGCVRYGVLPKAVKTDILNDNSRESFIDNYRLKTVNHGILPKPAVIPEPYVAPAATQPAPAKPPGGPNVRVARQTAQR
jgi:hypothetical protein